LKDSPCLVIGFLICLHLECALMPNNEGGDDDKGDGEEQAC
jgi:hypothetical protein